MSVLAEIPLWAEWGLFPLCAGLAFGAGALLQAVWNRRNREAELEQAIARETASAEARGEQSPRPDASGGGDAAEAPSRPVDIAEEQDPEITR